MKRTTLVLLLIFLFACSDNNKHTVGNDCRPDNAVGSAEIGCVQVIEKSPVIAGKPSYFIVRFVVGSEGIKPGGSVNVAMHHAGKWFSQTISPSSNNFVTLAGEHTDQLELIKYPAAKAGQLFTQSKEARNFIFSKIHLANVIKGELVEGDVIDFVFGANEQGIKAPLSSDPDHELRVTADLDGDGKHSTTFPPVFLPVHPDIASSVSAITPSQVLAGQAFTVRLRVEDDKLNLIDDFAGTAAIYDEQNTLLISDIVISEGIGITQVSIPTTGHQRLRVKILDNTITGRSNPLRVFSELPEQRIYWADLHGHTRVSDGLGKDADEYFSFGRDIGFLDIAALTDHFNNAWEENIDAVKRYYQPGEYVTLLAQEFSPSPDHMNLYFRYDDLPHLPNHWGVSYKHYLEMVLTTYNQKDNVALTGPHHFAHDRGAAGDPDYPFRVWDNRVTRFVEVYSAHGTSEFKGNPKPLLTQSDDALKYMQGGLAEGLKFGVIGASDNHDSKPGRSIWGQYAGGLAAVLATALDREAVWDALWNYRVYGTSTDRIYIEYTLNGHRMGESFTTNSPTVTLDAYVIGKTDELRVEVIKNNEVIHTQDSANGLVEITLEDELSADREHFYYLRVTQSNGERAWSTPVWAAIN